METLEKFEKLKPEKKTKIINAGLESLVIMAMSKLQLILLLKKLKSQKVPYFIILKIRKTSLYIFLTMHQWK